jgi:cell division septation protein DedD
LTVESTPPATTTASTDNANGAAATAAPATAPATTAAAAPASATTASPTTTQAASLGNYRIQLASLKSEAAAQKTWKRLATKYKDVLASLTVHIQKVALTSGTYYRLQAGPFEDKTSANAACTKLRAHGQQCIVKP